MATNPPRFDARAPIGNGVHSLEAHVMHQKREAEYSLPTYQAFALQTRQQPAWIPPLPWHPTYLADQLGRDGMSQSGGKLP